MKAIILKKIDQQIYKFLESHVNIMPLRTVKLIALYYTDARIRKLYLRRLGVFMGEGTFSNLGMKLSMGASTEDIVDIKSNVSIGPGVTFVTEECANNGTLINEIPYVHNHLSRKGKITIEDNVWIGANVTILSGVTVGRCTVIGAGCVVLHDLEPFSVYAGVPARKIRSLEQIPSNT